MGGRRGRRVGPVRRGARPPADPPVAERTLPLRDLLEVHWGARGYQPGFSEGYRANFIPGGNLALLSVASLFAFVQDADALALGLLENNPYPDASPRFFSAFETLFAEGLGRPLAILTPFAELAKDEVVRIGEALPLELSLSCVNPVDGQHCGNGCNKCAERQKAFALAGIADPTSYRNPPPRVDWKGYGRRLVDEVGECAPSAGRLSPLSA